MRARRLVLLAALAIPGCGGGPERVAFDEPPALPPFVSVSRVEGFAPIPGAMAGALPGDVVLANDHIAVVIAAPRPERDALVVPGSLIDAAPRGGVDVLRALEPLGAAGPLRPVIRTITTELVDGEHAEAIARGLLGGAGTLEVEHVVRLAAGERTVEILSRVVNRGATAAEIEIGDRIAWGRAEPFLDASGDPDAPRRWIAGAGESTALLWASDTEHRVVNDASGVTRLSGGARLLAPGDTMEVRRRCVIAHGSIAEALRTMPALAPHAARVSVEVRDAAHLPVHGAVVDAFDPAGRLLLRGETNETGLTQLLVPPGTVVVEAWSPGRERRRAPAHEVRAGGDARIRVELPEPSRLTLRAIDEQGAALPAEWRVRGLDGTPDPVLGPPYRAGANGGAIFSAAADTTVLVPAGRYRVTATSGLRREGAGDDVSLDAAGHRELTFALPSIPLPATWAILDLHSHTLAAPACGVDAAARAAQLAAHGVDRVGFTDPGTSPVATTSQGPPRLDGEETFAGPHRLAWFAPGRTAPARPGEAAGATLAERARAVRESVPGSFLVVSSRCANAVDSSGAPSLDDLRAVDAWEIWSGARNRRWERIWARWMELLASGQRIVAVGAGAAMDLPSLEDGLPATLVRLPEAARPAGGDIDLFDALRAGRCQVTNGPFIDFALGGVAPGDTLRARPGTVEARIRVLAPRRVDVRRVVVVVNGFEQAAYMVRGTDRTTRFDETVELPFHRSGFALIRVEGAGSGGEGREGASGAGPRPLAFTNPVWVEISPGPR